MQTADPKAKAEHESSAYDTLNFLDNLPNEPKLQLVVLTPFKIRFNPKVSVTGEARLEGSTQGDEENGYLSQIELTDGASSSSFLSAEVSNPIATSGFDGGGTTTDVSDADIETLKIRTLTEDDIEASKILRNVDEVMEELFAEPSILPWDQRVMVYPVLRVGCNTQEGYLHKALFVNGQRGACISYSGCMCTPSEFEFLTGFPARTLWSWKYSISVDGYPLGLLIKISALPDEDYPIEENWDDILAKHLGPSRCQINPSSDLCEQDITTHSEASENKLHENQPREQRVRTQSESDVNMELEEVYDFESNSKEQQYSDLIIKQTTPQLDPSQLPVETDSESIKKQIMTLPDPDVKNQLPNPSEPEAQTDPDHESSEKQSVVQSIPNQRQVYPTDEQMDAQHISIKYESIAERAVIRPDSGKEAHFGGFLTRENWEKTIGKDVRMWFEQVSRLASQLRYGFDQLPENAVPYVWVTGFKKYLIMPRKVIFKLLEEVEKGSTINGSASYTHRIPLQVLWITSIEGCSLDVLADKIVGISSGSIANLDFIKKARDELVSN